MRNRNKSYHHWSEADDQDLMKNYKGQNAKLFADKYGVSENTIRVRYCKLTAGEQKSFRYSAEDVNYIIENWGKDTAENIANHLGTTARGVRLKAMRLRRNVFVVKNHNVGGTVAPIGAIKVKKNRSKYQKTEKGWVYIGVVPKEKKPKPVKELKPKIITKKIVVNYKPAKPEIKRMETKPFTTEGKKLIQVNKRTWIWKKVG